MNFLFIDGNSVGYSCHYATKLNVGGMETQAIFGFVKTMRELRVIYPTHTPIVLWDGRAEWRFKLHPDYKSNRDNDPKKLAVKEAYQAQVPYIQRMNDTLGIRQLKVFTHEADDMAGHMVSKFAKDGNQIVLISGDRDWIQLVRPGVTWRDMRDDSRIVTLDNLLDKTGYATPLAFLEGKCLQGDTSDCIPGVGGIGEKGAPEFMAEFGSVRNFLRRVDSGDFVPKKKAHINLASPEGRRAFARNLRMMQLLKVEKPNPDKVDRFNANLNPERFQALCEDLAFRSIATNIETFIKPFKE